MNYNYYDNFNNLVGFNNNANTSPNNYSGSSIDVYSPLEGFNKGNMFSNLYSGYKNYKPSKIKINSEQEEMLLNISELSFASHDLNLYLDVHPNNQEALNLFNNYRRKANELTEMYERKYESLSVSMINNDTVPFNWAISKWPWEDK